MSDNKYLDFTIHISNYLQAIENLSTVQKLTRDASMYQYGAGGNYNLISPTKSWCNQSTFDIMEATGFHTKGLYVDTGKYRGRYNTNANYAAKQLNEMSKEPLQTGILRVTPKSAQFLANYGLTVVAGFEDTDASKWGGEKNTGHLSTVVSESKTTLRYSEEAGPIISNVGSTVGVMTTQEGFWRADLYEGGWKENVNFYVDLNQTLIFDISNVAKDMTK